MHTPIQCALQACTQTHVCTHAPIQAPSVCVYFHSVQTWSWNKQCHPQDVDSCDFVFLWIQKNGVTQAGVHNDVLVRFILWCGSSPLMWLSKMKLLLVIIRASCCLCNFLPNTFYMPHTVVLNIQGFGSSLIRWWWESSSWEVWFQKHMLSVWVYICLNVRGELPLLTIISVVSLTEGSCCLLLHSLPANSRLRR